VSDRLPLFRADIQISVHHEGGEAFLILHDVYGVADGPIMVHSDMVSVLEVCDGETTWHALAESSDVDIDGPEITKLRAFIGQLDELGFFDTDKAEARRSKTEQEWAQLETRPPTCAGSTYPADADELHVFLDDLLSAETPAAPSFEADAYLIPHIDYRVAPAVYAPAFNALRESDADLFVMIGTSHYWSDDAVILTDKHYLSPLGEIPTDRELVSAIRQELGEWVAPSDLAHKPEHSIELHAVLLQHIRNGRPFSILPILVTGIDGDEGYQQASTIARAVRSVVDRSGRKAMWLISGDLAHVGRKFGDDTPAASLLPDVSRADRELVDLLEGADIAGYHRAIEATDHVYRICGHAPTVIGLLAMEARRGKLLAYDVWDERETESAVTFATLAFGGNPRTP
jgi:MEMO1 family protein